MAPARRVLALLLSLILPGLAVAADDGATLLAQWKAASGGARWDAVATFESEGRIAAGGLEGRFSSRSDLARSRTVTRYVLGPVAGADGNDGTHVWRQDPGGEIAVLDAPEALRRARTQAWLDARAYWYPQRGRAHYAAPVVRQEGDRRFLTVVATPEGGDPVTLWFAAESHLLVRTEQKQDAFTAVSDSSDWREVDGLRLPFHVVTDMVDGAGRRDERMRTEAHVERYTAGVAVSDADFVVPTMDVRARIVDAGGITRIPFDLVNNHIYAHGSIDGKPARFLVDTGGANLLTPATARKYGLDTSGQLAGQGVGEKAVDMALANAREVRLGGAVLERPTFYIMDLGDIPAVEGVDFDGLVGYEMFRRFGVTIDYAKRELVLAEPARFTAPAGAQVIPFELAERIPIVRGRLDGHDVRLSVDTGSRASLSLHSPFVRGHDLVARYRAAPEAVVGWGVGGASRGRPARFGELELGGLVLPAVAGDLYTGDKGAFASPDVSGNLGGGVLRRFTVAFDYANKRMHLAPNAHFAQTDVFDRSGLWLMADGDSLRIADVAPQSAARHARLQVGDRIVTIDGEAAAERGLAGWRARLREQPAGTKLRLEVRRGDAKIGVTLVLADRIPAQSPARR